MIAVNGKFYGTTLAGGTSGYAGTVFSVTATGTESVLHNFGVLPGDGVNSFAALIAVRGTLYGTTCCGGAAHHGPLVSATPRAGTIFATKKSGKETVVYSFNGDPDGSSPYAGLSKVGGTLYGITAGGGASNDGTVFKLTPSGSGYTETVLYSFQGGSDGATPYFGSLVELNGVLYGTTGAGGGAGCTTGCGTVFSVTTSGSEHVVYSFKGGNDGATPFGGLHRANGKLFGTTQFGGGTGCYESLGCGTIFSVTPSGKERLLHTFAGGSDGENPLSNLISLNGMLYGTTYGAGDSSDWGTVFSLRP